MRRALSNLLNLTMGVLGIAFIAGGIMGFTLGDAKYKGMVTYGFALAFAVMLVLALSLPYFAGRDRRKTQRGLLSITAFLYFLYFVYFGVMWTLLGEKGIKISICVLFPLLGIATLFLVILNFLIGNEDYGPMALDFLKQLPFLYYRYRT